MPAGTRFSRAPPPADQRPIMSHAILEAHGSMASEWALIPLDIAETEAKRERTERKRKSNQRTAARWAALGHAETSAAMGRVLHKQELRLAKLDAKLADDPRHRTEGAIPCPVFGGKRR